MVHELDVSVKGLIPSISLWVNFNSFYSLEYLIIRILKNEEAFEHQNKNINLTALAHFYKRISIFYF